VHEQFEEGGGDCRDVTIQPGIEEAQYRQAFEIHVEEEGVGGLAGFVEIVVDEPGPEPVEVEIWVDQEEGTYEVGDELEVCYQVSRPVALEIQIGPEPFVPWPEMQPAEGETRGCHRTTVDEGISPRAFRIVAFENGEWVADDDTYFYVEEPEPDPVEVEIWVDKGEGATYKDGEVVEVCYSVSRAVQVEVYHSDQGVGSGAASDILVEGLETEGGRCLGFVAPYTPEGPKHWLHIDASESGARVAEDEAYFFVEKEEEEEDEPVGSPPSPPRKIRASDGTHTLKVRIEWKASSGATHYEIWETDGSYDWTHVGTTSYTTFDYQLEYPLCEVDWYMYTVTACNDFGCSDYGDSDFGWDKCE
jgi:hypothetical protein